MAGLSGTVVKRVDHNLFSYLIIGTRYYTYSVLRSKWMGNFNRDDRSDGRRNFGRRDSGRRGFGGRSERREMHKAVCSNCGKDCEVPFKPTGSKPVFCSECFERNGGGADSRRIQGRGPIRTDFERRKETRPQNSEQFEAINSKLDKILEMLTAAPLKEEKETKAEPEEITIAAKKKMKTPKKKTSDTKE